MKRRKFITLSALAAAAISTPFVSCNGTDPELDKKLALPQTLAQLADKKEIKEIGKKYGAARTEAYSIKALEQELAKNSDGGAVSSVTPAKDIYANLNESIQNDFEKGNTVVVNGWVLAVTEARQCALFSLMPQQN